MRARRSCRRSFRSLSGNARFSATVMCGQTAYDWKTMPRLRRSAGTLTRRPGSKNVSPPTTMRPPSGRCSPATHMSVVDLPQPLGPSSVKSSPSSTRNSTSSSARCPPNCLTSRSTWISGIVTSRHASLEHGGADRKHNHRRGHLDERERGDGTDHPLQELVEHGRSDHLRPRLHEEECGIVVVEQLDEHQDEGREDRRTQQRQDDLARRRPPAGADRPSGTVELLADPRE